MCDEWIWICRWEEFQHYQPRRDRGPAWIKTHTAQLWDDRYLSLNSYQRGLLHDLRMVFANCRGKVPKDTRKLSGMVGQRVTTPTLEALNHAGFIQFVSRETLDLALEQLYSRSRSRSIEKEKDLGVSGTSLEGPNSNGEPSLMGFQIPTDLLKAMP